jgi:hypothetical protein
MQVETTNAQVTRRSWRATRSSVQRGGQSTPDSSRSIHGPPHTHMQTGHRHRSCSHSIDRRPCALRSTHASGRVRRVLGRVPALVELALFPRSRQPPSSVGSPLPPACLPFVLLQTVFIRSHVHARLPQAHASRPHSSFLRARLTTSKRGAAARRRRCAVTAARTGVRCGGGPASDSSRWRRP